MRVLGVFYSFLMNLQINNYIDFDKLFIALVEECKEDLIEHQHEASHYKDILLFFGLEKSSYEIEPLECELSDKQICFSYLKENNDANESNNQNSVDMVLIIYDIILSEFTVCEVERF